MTTLKVIEVLSESEKSWEDAVQTAVTRASTSVKNIRSVYIEHLDATVDDGKVTQYRVNAKISFVVEDKM